jgi:hypothetical protein
MSDVRSFAWIAVLSELLAGCLAGGAGSSGADEPDVPAPTGTALAAFDGGDPTCPEWGCGTNSPTLADGIVFDELDTAGARDRHGIKIVEAKQGSVQVKLVVDRQVLSARATDGSGRMFEHGALVGTVITLEKDGQIYGFRIDGVDENSLRFWAGDTTEIVPFYRILVKLPGTPSFKAALCRQNVGVAEKVWSPVEHSAIVFAGDRYDPPAKKVADAEPATTWFNLACAGTATAKMHLMRHTNAGAWTAASWTPGHEVTDPAAPFHTDVASRQAMVKMFVADYCGVGDAFTVDGQPLLYDDSKHWFAPGSISVAALRVAGDGTLSPSGSTMEALWTDHGALCVSEPRHVDRSAVACLGGPTPLPLCTADLIAGWELAAHVISANPWRPAP